MYYTYILYSECRKQFYIGYSSNPEKRLKERHNKGLVRSTKAGIPYKLMVKKGFRSQGEARKEERRLKKTKNRGYLEWLIDGNW